MRASISTLERKARNIKKLQLILNTILANACYSEKEMHSQIEIAQSRGNLDDEELALIRQTWKARNMLARQLIQELREMLGGMMDEKREDA